MLNSLENFKPSFHKALNGYDVGLSNPFAKAGDPAVKGRIFDIHCESQDGRAGHYNFVRLEDDRRCDQRFSQDVVTSSKDYSKLIGSSNTVNVLYSKRFSLSYGIIIFIG